MAACYLMLSYCPGGGPASHLKAALYFTFQDKHSNISKQKGTNENEKNKTACYHLSILFSTLLKPHTLQKKRVFSTFSREKF